MTKNAVTDPAHDPHTGEEIPVYTGFYTPHAPVDWTGLVQDVKTGKWVKEETLTKQSFKDECDINLIVRQYSPQKLAELMAERAQLGRFDELPTNFDYQDALNVVVEGQRAFESLPSNVRERFLNDPARFLAFMADPDSQDEAIRLGLATRKEEPKPPEPSLADQIVDGITRAGKPPKKTGE